MTPQHFDIGSPNQLMAGDKALGSYDLRRGWVPSPRWGYFVLILTVQANLKEQVRKTGKAYTFLVALNSKSSCPGEH
jgi:hypothetical protein